MPLGIDVQQILLHILNFVILFGGLYILLYKPVKKFMDGRAAAYAEMDRKTQEELEKATEAKSAYEEKLKNADAEIARRKEEAFREFAAWKEENEKKTEKEKDAYLKEARENAENERRKILEDARREISDIAADAAAKVIGKTDVGSTYDCFLDAVERGKERE